VINFGNFEDNALDTVSLSLQLFFQDLFSKKISSTYLEPKSFLEIPRFFLFLGEIIARRLISSSICFVMDIGTHLVTGLVVSTFFQDPTAQVVAVVGSCAPDLSLIPVYIHRFFLHKEWKVWQYLGEEEHSPPPHNMMRWYYLFHSFLWVGILFFLAWWFQYTVLLAFAIGYLTHIFWDIPSHQKEWANRPLYPLSEFHIEGMANWWKHPHRLSGVTILWGILLTVYFFLS
jgi:hypothetical protein